MGPHHRPYPRGAAAIRVHLRPSAVSPFFRRAIVNNTDKLFDVFQQVFGIGDVSKEMTQDDIPEWNSLQMINLIMALEEVFEVQIMPEEAADMLSVELVMDVLQEKGVEFSS
jgi:acyl carrier protein